MPKKKHITHFIIIIICLLLGMIIAMISKNKKQTTFNYVSSFSLSLPPDDTSLGYTIHVDGALSGGFITYHFPEIEFSKNDQIKYLVFAQEFNFYLENSSEVIASFEIQKKIDSISIIDTMLQNKNLIIFNYNSKNYCDFKFDLECIKYEPGTVIASNKSEELQTDSKLALNDDNKYTLNITQVINNLSQDTKSVVVPSKDIVILCRINLLLYFIDSHEKIISEKSIKLRSLDAMYLYDTGVKIVKNGKEFWPIIYSY